MHSSSADVTNAFCNNLFPYEYVNSYKLPIVLCPVIYPGYEVSKVTFNDIKIAKMQKQMSPAHRKYEKLTGQRYHCTAWTVVS